MQSFDLIHARLSQYCASSHSMRFDLDYLKTIVHQLFPDGMRCPYVLVGGTNAKGSTVNLLASMLKENSHQIGVYTSPHLASYCERISLDEKHIEQYDFLELIDQVHAVLGNNESLTFFEFLTLSAILYFENQWAKNQCDLAILEVGLGGRLDATNVVEPILSIITTVDFDHCYLLGNDKEKIGLEKSGIMRKNKVGIFVSPDVPKSVFKYAETVGVNLKLTSDFLRFKRLGRNQCILALKDKEKVLDLSSFLETLDVPYCLLAAYHGVLELKSLGFSVCEQSVKRAVSCFEISGRRQCMIWQNRKILLDVGHNVQAVGSLSAYLEDIQYQRVFCIFYALDDKLITQMLQMIKRKIFYWQIVKTLNCKREPSINAWQSYLKKLNLSNFHISQSFSEAISNTVKVSCENDLILIFGSFLLVGEALKYFDDAI